MFFYISIIIGIILLSFGGDYLVKGSSGLARKLKISPMIIGIVIIGFGTSVPEIFVASNAVINNSSDIALGSIVGSNIANILLVFSFGLLIAKDNILKVVSIGDMLVMLAVTLLLSIFLIIGSIKTPLSFIMILLLPVYFYCSYNFFNKKLSNLRVTLVGDLKNGRTVKSLVKLLNRFENNHFNLVSPKDLSLSSDLPKSYYETGDINEVLKETDILYVTRVQKERGSVHDYSLTLKQLESLPENSIVMHPFPRVSEIPVEFDIDKRAKYFDQIRYGVWCRQILLERVMK